MTHGKDGLAEGFEALGIRNVGETKQLPPTLTAALYPMGILKPESEFQPYAGLGIKFTYIFDEEASSRLESAAISSDAHGRRKVLMFYFVTACGNSRVCYT